MKLLVLSDTQLDSGRNLLPGGRLADQEAMLDRIAELAEAERVDVVVHAGDLFDSRHPSEEARLVAKQFIDRIAERAMTVIVAGNHDLRNAELASSVDLYDHCDFVRKPQIVSYAGVSIACLPWVPLSRLVASRNGGDRGMLHAEAAGLLVEVARGLRAEAGNGPAILVGHWPVSGATLPTGLPVDQLNTVVLPCAELEAQGWDAAVFGDIHVPAILSPGAYSVDGDGSHHAAGQPIISCGTPWVNTWGEAHVPHGVWMLEEAA